jgi:hypothetical protein
MAGTVIRGAIAHRSRGVVRTSIAITCDAAGVATATSVGAGFGRLVGVMYDGGLDASAVITLADGKTGATFLVYTTGTEGVPVFLRPTLPIQDQAGTIIADATTAPNTHREIILAGKVTVAVASGGVSETCKLALIVDEAYIGDLALTV